MLDVRKFEEERGLKPAHLIAIIREMYPKYDKSIHSHVKNPENYGVRWVDDLELAILEAFPEKPEKRPTEEHRRFPCRVQARLSKHAYGLLQQRLAADGFDTVQAGLSFIISKYIREGIQ